MKMKQQRTAQLLFYEANKNTHSLSLSLARTHTLSLSRSLSHARTHTLSLSRTHTHKRTDSAHVFMLHADLGHGHSGTLVSRKVVGLNPVVSWALRVCLVTADLIQVCECE